MLKMGHLDRAVNPAARSPTSSSVAFISVHAPLLSTHPGHCRRPALPRRRYLPPHFASAFAVPFRTASPTILFPNTLPVRFASTFVAPLAHALTNPQSPLAMHPSTNPVANTLYDSSNRSTSSSSSHSQTRPPSTSLSAFPTPSASPHDSLPPLPDIPAQPAPPAAIHVANTMPTAAIASTSSAANPPIAAPVKTIEKRGRPRGHRHSEESRRKIGLANRGNVPWNKGRRHSEETKRKIAENTRRAMLRPELRQMLKQRALGRRHSEETKLKIRHSSRLVRSARNTGSTKASTSSAPTSAAADTSTSSISTGAKAEPDTLDGSVRAASSSSGTAANVVSSAAASSKVESPRALVGSATKNMAGMSIAEAVLQIPFQQYRKMPIPFHYSAETVSQLHASIEEQAVREFSKTHDSKKLASTSSYRPMSEETKEKLRQRIKQKWDEDPAYGSKVRNAIQERAQRMREEKASVASSSRFDLGSLIGSKARAGKSNATDGTRSKSNSPSKRARRSSTMPSSAHEQQLQQLKDSMYGSSSGVASQLGYKKEDTLHPTADVTDAEMDGNEQENVMKIFFGENESNVVLDGITKDDLHVDGFHGEGAVPDYGSGAFNTSVNMITPQIPQVPPSHHHPQDQSQSQQPQTSQQLYHHQIAHNHTLPQQQSHMQPPLAPPTAQQLHHQPPQPAHTQGMGVLSGPAPQGYASTVPSSQLHSKPDPGGVSEHRTTGMNTLGGDVNLPVTPNENIEVVGMATASDLRTPKKTSYRTGNVINNSNTLLPESFAPHGSGAGGNSGNSGGDDDDDDDDELPAVVQGYGLMTTNMNVSVNSEAQEQVHLQPQPGPPHSHGQTGLFNDDGGNVVGHGLGAADAAYGGGQTHLAGTYAAAAAVPGAHELHRGVSQQQTGPMPAMPAMPMQHGVVQHAHAHRQHGHPGVFQQHAASFALQGEHVDQTHVGDMPPYMGDGVGNISAAAARAANVDVTSARLVDHQHQHQHTYHGGHPSATASNANAESLSVPAAPRNMVDGMPFSTMAMDKAYDDADPLDSSNDAHNANSF